MISHRYKCIFTHIPKAAGKSILGLFGLPEFGKDYHEPLAHIEDPYDHRPLAIYSGKPYFRSYLKFAFTRNPWDRLVSTFFYLDHGGCNQWDEAFRQRYLQSYRGDFRAFTRDLEGVLATKHFLPQYLWISDHRGGLLTDFVGKFESLGDDLATLGERIGLDVAGLTHRNRSQHRPYTEYYDEESRDLVAHAYARDIEIFGYRFDGIGND